MRTEDGNIIQECLDGRQQAFGMLVDKYKEGVYAFVYAELGDFQDAQDVTQEVFLQAYRDLRSLRRWESFVFWLYRIARRRCIQWFRDRSRRVDREFIEDQDPKVMDAHSLDSYRDSQLSESLGEALDSLPEIHREVLLLHYFGGMNSKEIARAIGTSPGAVRMRLTRARAQLREEMVAMMDTAFEGQRIPAGFTLRIVEMVKHIKIHPIPRMAGLPWGLSLAVGIIITVMSLNPHISTSRDMTNPAGLPLPVKTKILKTGEIPVDVLNTDKIPVIGNNQGNKDGGKPQNTFFLAPQQDGAGRWSKKADMQTPRVWHGSCAVGESIYVIGGVPQTFNKPRGMKTAERYDPANDMWTNIAEMPQERYMFSPSANLVNGKIYIIGGTLRGGVDVPVLPVLEYDQEKDIWATKGKAPIEIALHCCAVVNEKIYMIGGTDAKGNARSSVYEYSPESDTWVQKTDMPTVRFSMDAAVVNDKIYVMGGAAPKFTSNVDWDELKTVEEYDPATDTWTAKADMPDGRDGFSASVLNGKIYIIGGWRGGPKGNMAQRSSIVEEYDPLTDKWKKVSELPTVRGYPTTSVINGRIYAIGGGIGGGTGISIVEEYTPEDWQPAEQSSVSPDGKLPTKWGEVKSE